MRILTLILAVLCLLVTAGLGGFSYSELSASMEEKMAADGITAEQLEAAEELSATIEKETGTAVAGVEELGQAKRTLYMWLALAVLAFVLTVLVFVKKAVLPVGALVAVLAIASFILMPQQEAFQKLGMIIAIPAVLGAVFAILTEKLRQKNAAAA